MQSEDHELDGLADCVRTEWSTFYPPCMRLRAKPGRFQGRDVVPDQSIHVAAYDQMAPPDGRVRLEVLDDVDDAVDMVTARYDQLTRSEPDLARNISPAAPDDLRHWLTSPASFPTTSSCPASGRWILPDQVLGVAVKDCGVVAC